MRFTVRGVSQEIADEVRRTRRSPQYGHPVHEEIATGSGPCRCCLQPFVEGRDQRLLFTYRPQAENTSLMAPGPVFIHAEPCRAFQGPGFPEALRTLPLAFEARTSHSRVNALASDPARTAEAHIEALLGSDEPGWLHLRHAQAGCFIARIDRA